MNPKPPAAALVAALLCAYGDAAVSAQPAEPERAVTLFVVECERPVVDVDEVERVLCAALGPDRRACDS